MNSKKHFNDKEILHAFIDGELDEQQHKALMETLDENNALRNEACDIHYVKELLQLAYPLDNENTAKINVKAKSYHLKTTAAAFLLMLGLGFLGGYISSDVISSDNRNHSVAAIDQQATALPSVPNPENKVIIYLGRSGKDKFHETLDKAEDLLNKYKQAGTQVYVVTSAGGIDLLRNNTNNKVRQRIKNMSGLYKSLHFVACNNQIYELHKKGQDVKLVDEVEVAPSAVQFVVDHLKKGWKYIAI